MPGMKIAFFFHAWHEIFDGLPRFVPRLFLRDHGTGRWYQREAMWHEIFGDMLFRIFSSVVTPSKVPQTV